jgi:hypothetical protein
LTDVPPPASAEPQQQNADSMRAIMREEINAAQEKPPKLPINERVVQLEGLMLRMMEHMGLVQPDPNLMRDQAPAAEGATGMAPGVMPDPTQSATATNPGTAPGPQMGKTASLADSYLDELVGSHGYAWVHKEADADQALTLGTGTRLIESLPASPQTGTRRPPAGLQKAAARLRQR